MNLGLQLPQPGLVPLAHKEATQNEIEVKEKKRGDTIHRCLGTTMWSRNWSMMAIECFRWGNTSVTRWSRSSVFTPAKVSNFPGSGPPLV